MIYTGVGSRKAPGSIKRLIEEISEAMAQKGWILRSGGASGADSAFEYGCQKVKGKQEIYLPWQGFNDKQSEFNTVSEEAMDIAKSFHPRWSTLLPTSKLLHGRNAYQVLGFGLKRPSDLLICWTLDGCFSHDSRCSSTGGTGTAISIADKYNVPIINLQNEGSLTRLEEIISTQIIIW